MNRRKRAKYARCTVCSVWRSTREMKSDSDICEAGTETPIFRFWECRTHTPKQLKRRNARTAAFIRRIGGLNDQWSERLAKEVENSND